MKKQLLTILTLLMFVTISTVNFAGEDDIKKGSSKYQQIESNLLVGLESSNFGLRTSSAYMLGEMKSDKAVNPLTKMLRGESDERARIAAALALIKIGTDRSVYMVQMGAKFNESQRVRYLCEKFYYAYLLNNYNKQNVDKQIIYAELVD
ncbi:MAG: HEAT repeat domain-containing protein [Melioribacteraceae bacterium]|nr:HEAT repeat domain-containing protein [Melioribacteraceae bacterium]